MAYMNASDFIALRNAVLFYSTRQERTAGEALDVASPVPFSHVRTRLLRRALDRLDAATRSNITSYGPEMLDSAMYRILAG